MTTKPTIKNPYLNRKETRSDASDGVARRLDYGITEP